MFSLGRPAEDMPQITSRICGVCPTAHHMATPKAQAADEEFFKVLGGKPVHHTLANHWARVIEMIQAAARIAMSVEKAAKGLIKGGQVTEGLLNKVEMAFRAYDPCLGCATHSLPGHTPLKDSIYDPDKTLVRELIQG